MQLELITAKNVSIKQVTDSMNKYFKSKEQFSQQFNIICLKVAQSFNMVYSIESNKAIFKDKELIP